MKHTIFFTIALVISMIAGVTATVFPFWLMYVWILLPLGVIAGFYHTITSDDQFFLIVVVLVIVSGNSLTSVLSAIPILGTIVATFIESLLLFIPALYFTSGLKYFITTMKKKK